MYATFFKELIKKSLSPYKSMDLQAFNDSITHFCGNIELPAAFEKEESERICRCNLGRPSFLALDIVASTIHLKMKYHNDLNELVTIQYDLFESRLIPKTC